MTAPSRTRGGSRLHRLAHRSSGAVGDAAPQPSTAGSPGAGSTGADLDGAGPTGADEHCELCGTAIGQEHRHLLALDSRELICACRPCALLFDREGAAAGRYKLIPERRLRLAGFELSDAVWEELRVPVDMAFFFRSSAAGRVLAYYPSPMGPTESQLPLDAWQELEHENPVLSDLEEDVEALLADRVRGARRYWLVPLDECYRLIGLIRTRWRGLTGGKDLWREIESFFSALDERSRTASPASRPAWARQKGATA